MKGATRPVPCGGGSGLGAIGSVATRVQGALTRETLRCDAPSLARTSTRIHAFHGSVTGEPTTALFRCGQPKQRLIISPDESCRHGPLHLQQPQGLAPCARAGSRLAARAEGIRRPASARALVPSAHAIVPTRVSVIARLTKSSRLALAFRAACSRLAAAVADALGQHMRSVRDESAGAAGTPMMRRRAAHTRRPFRRTPPPKRAPTECASVTQCEMYAANAPGSGGAAEPRPRCGPAHISVPRRWWPVT